MRRILVVGASSGIGRSLSAQCLARGDAVVLAARRRALLDDLIASAGDRALALALALACDTSDPEAGPALVAAAAAFLEPHGGLDTVIYAAGMAPLGPLSSTAAPQWHQLLATNLVGAALVVTAALPELRRSGQPTVVLLSSSSVDAPWPGLVPYAASKAGLNQLALGLRAEEPGVRTIRVAVGPTATGFADGWDTELAGTYLGQWAELGHLRHEIQAPEQTAASILAAVDDPASPDDLLVIGPETD